jgi:predicted RNA-binding Zn ribbon-like protein
MKFNASYFIGGSLCVDFCNTFDHLHLPPKHDLFTDYATILDWGKAAGVIAGHPTAVPASRRREIADLLAVRSLIYRMLLPFAHGAAPAAADVAAFNARLQKVSGSLQLVSAKGGYTLVGSAEDPLERIAVEAVRSAAELLVSGRPDQIRLCGECGWMFYDTSRNHLRRWCSMKICGNRAKARRHYERERRKLSTAVRAKPKLQPELRSG